MTTKILEDSWIKIIKMLEYLVLKFNLPQDLYVYFLKK